MSSCGCADDSYEIGSLVRIFTTFTQNSVPVDPGTLRLKIKPPDEPVQTLTYPTSSQLVRTATGSYHSDVTPTVSGQWWYRWESDAPGQGAREGSFYVNPSEFY